MDTFLGLELFYLKNKAPRSIHDTTLTGAGGLGIEPKLMASKATVLPLDDPPIFSY